MFILRYSFSVGKTMLCVAPTTAAKGNKRSATCLKTDRFRDKPPGDRTASEYRQLVQRCRYTPVENGCTDLSSGRIKLGK